MTDPNSDNIKKAQMLSLEARQARAQGDWKRGAEIEAKMHELYVKMGDGLELPSDFNLPHPELAEASG
jgi:hypothetical protein